MSLSYLYVLFHLYTFHEPLAVHSNTVKRKSITNIDVKHNNVKLLIVNIFKSGDDDIKFWLIVIQIFLIMNNVPGSNPFIHKNDRPYAQIHTQTT